MTSYTEDAAQAAGWITWLAEENERLRAALEASHADNLLLGQVITKLQAKEAAMHTVLMYKDDAGEWRWHRDAGQGDIVSDSGEGYVNKEDCREMAMAVNGGDFELVVLDGDSQN
jgi:uncharacterized protein YegP (UPF0339 family)